MIGATILLKMRGGGGAEGAKFAEETIVGASSPGLQHFFQMQKEHHNENGDHHNGNWCSESSIVVWI